MIVSMPDLALPIETERLRIRLFEPGDCGPFVDFMTDPESTRYLEFGDAQKTETGAGEVFEAVLASYERSDPMEAYAVEHKASGGYVGSCGFAPVTEGAVECYYTIVPAHRRKGYALEAMQALLAALPGPIEVSAYCHPDNLAGAGLAVELGMERRGRSGHRKLAAAELFTYRKE